MAQRAPAALATFLRHSAKGNVPQAMEVFAEQKEAWSASQMVTAIGSLEAAEVMGAAFQAHEHSLIPTLKEMSDKLADDRLAAALTILSGLETQHPTLSPQQQVHAITALMHVRTTCGYRSTKRIPEMYNDLGAKGLQPSLATCLVTARALLLLRQFQALESFVERLRFSTANLPLPFFHVLLDMHNEEENFSKAHDLFHDVLRQYSAATPYMFDAHWRTCQQVGAPRRYTARLQRLMFESGIQPRQVAASTWQGIQVAVGAEAADREDALKRQHSVDHKLQQGGVFHPAEFEGLLTTSLRQKLKKGKYDSENEKRAPEDRRPLPRFVAPLPPGWGN
eukprot:GGOE01053777.1.p1 GENE.GGOE01053777.1~~GGOE01053777.1.p1  ORF type:complete len:337 (-),score=89.95 GGOE01053777.1:96-1106(-)